MKVRQEIGAFARLEAVIFVNKLPKQPSVFNNLLEYFIEKKDNNKYLCSVWNLHSSNLDTLIRKSNYNNGFSLVIVKKIMQIFHLFY